MLIALFFMAIPLVPANAASATVSISSINADLGSSFTMTVNVDGTPNLEGYDISIRANPDVITVTSASLSGSMFDPATNNLLIARQEVIPAIGLVRYALVILGGTTVGPSGTVLTISAKANDPASTPQATASEYPSEIRVISSTLVSLVNGQVSTVPNTATGTTYTPPSNVGYRGCTGPVPFFDTTASGLSLPISCAVVNTGTGGIQVRGDFSYRSLRGLTGTVTGTTTGLTGGQAGQVTGSLTLAPQTIDIFVFSGQGTRLITFSDGSVLEVAGAAQHFSVTVYTSDFQGEFSGQNGG